MSSILFTVDISPNAGLTDQLTQLFVFYTLGRHCGFEFRLTPLRGTRSADRLWEHYDLRRHFTPLSESEAALPVVEPDLSVRILKERHIDTVDALVSLVRSQLASDTRLVRFQSGAHRHVLIPMLARVALPAAAEFQERMRRLLAPTVPWPSDDVLRVACHLRCGDDTDIPVFPDRTYRANGACVASSIEHRPTPFLGARVVLDFLAENLPNRRLDARVFTDGYERTGKFVTRSAPPDGPLTRGELEVLHRVLRFHEAMAGFLMQGPGIHFDSGESLESLQRLLGSVQQADLLVTTGNQRMLPKLLALLGERPERPGLLLMECKPGRVRNARNAGLTERHARLITLSSHGDPLAPLRSFLEHRSDPRSPTELERLAQEHRAGLFCVTEVEQLAERLEAQGRQSEAAAMHGWWTRISDGDPRSLSGLERCSRAAGDPVTAEKARVDQLRVEARRQRWGLDRTLPMPAQGRTKVASPTAGPPPTAGTTVSKDQA